MSARLFEIFVPEGHVEQLQAILARHSRRFWQEAMQGERVKFGCLVQQRYTERLIEDLEANFADLPGFSAHISHPEAVLPPIEETPSTALPDASQVKPSNAIERFFTRDRISTDELLDDINDSIRIRPTYLLTVGLSSIIAALGMRSGQTAVVIGAMIIAPLLGPTMGMALAATVGDARLGHRAAITLLVGCIVAIAGGLLVGMSTAIDPAVAELHSRTVMQPADIALALACGAAGVLAVSRAASLSLVGVMIAVALVPPLAAVGVYAGQGLYESAVGAFQLFATNLVCLNVAGIATFLIQGLPPKNWRITSGILLVWSLLLLLLVSLLAESFRLLG